MYPSFYTQWQARQQRLPPRLREGLARFILFGLAVLVTALVLRG